MESEPTKVVDVTYANQRLILIREDIVKIQGAIDARRKELKNLQILLHRLEGAQNEWNVYAASAPKEVQGKNGQTSKNR